MSWLFKSKVDKKRGPSIETARKGGRAKVPKGFAKMDPERHAELSRLGGSISRKKGAHIHDSHPHH